MHLFTGSNSLFLLMLQKQHQCSVLPRNTSCVHRSIICVLTSDTNHQNTTEFLWILKCLCLCWCQVASSGLDYQQSLLSQSNHLTWSHKWAKGESPFSIGLTDSEGTAGSLRVSLPRDKRLTAQGFNKTWIWCRVQVRAIDCSTKGPNSPLNSLRMSGDI